MLIGKFVKPRCDVTRGRLLQNHFLHSLHTELVFHNIKGIALYLLIYNIYYLFIDLLTKLSIQMVKPIKYKYSWMRIYFTNWRLSSPALLTTISTGPTPHY